MGENKFEKSQERNPTKSEVLEVISRFTENTVLVRELSDRQGLYLLETKKDGDEGEYAEYLYLRKGKFPNGQEAEVTTITIAHCKDGIPFTGGTLADYDSQKNEWKTK